MSAALVRKALEISAEERTVGVWEKSVKNKGRRKLKSIEKQKNKLTPEQRLRRNLKTLKALEFSSRAKKYGKAEQGTTTAIHIPKIQSKEEEEPETSLLSSDKKRKKKNKKNNQQSSASSSAFTEEDFEKFEKEYFVTD